MKIVISTIFSFLICIIVANATDSNQTLPDQIKDSYYDNLPEVEEQDNNLLENASIDDDKSKIYFPSTDSNDEYLGKSGGSKDKSINLELGNYGGENYLTYSEKARVIKVQNKGTKDFMISFMKDSYSYDDSQNVFKKTFEANSDSSIKGGLLYFSLNDYIWRTKLINGKAGLNFGVGFNQGDGIFKGGTLSRTQIKLYTLPIELNLASEINLSRFLKLQVGVGPSLLGLIQNRNDRLEDDDDKEIRQISFGYFYNIGLKVSLSDIFYSSVGHKVLSIYDMSKLNVDIFLRGQDYSNFKTEDLQITGTSIGLGFSFEFL